MFKNWSGGGLDLLLAAICILLKLIVLGWVGDAEMWELKIRCSNCGWMCKTQNMFKNWSGRGGLTGLD